MVSWHKSQEEASRLREVNRAATARLMNNNTKRGNAEEEGGGERKRERERESVERALLVVIASEQPAHSFFVFVFHFWFLLP